MLLPELLAANSAAEVPQWPRHRCTTLGAVIFQILINSVNKLKGDTQIKFPTRFEVTFHSTAKNFTAEIADRRNRRDDRFYILEYYCFDSELRAEFSSGCSAEEMIFLP